MTKTIGTSIAPFSGKYRSQEYDYNYWSGQISVAPMKRSDVVQWQSFLSNLDGTKNYFEYGDPDAFTPRGTYNNTHLLADIRVDSGSNVNSATLSFVASQSKITAGTAIFDGLVVIVQNHGVKILSVQVHGGLSGLVDRETHYYNPQHFLL